MENTLEKKILLSQSLRTDRIMALVMAGCFLFMPVVLIYADKINSVKQLYPFAIIYAFVFYGLYRNFSRCHPVYFDNKFLYWHKSEAEENVAFEKIKSISIVRLRGGKVGRVKYINNTGETKGCEWLIPDQEFYPYPNYRTLERLIQVETPDFKINGIHSKPCIFSRAHWNS